MADKNREFKLVGVGSASSQEKIEKPALSFMQDGFDGIVNAMPFTCMPSTVASSILKVYTRGQIPFVDMVYDGSIQPNRETNLATFVFQAKQHLNSKNS